MAWPAFYASHAVVRTVVSFVHVATLIVTGGAAIAIDRATLRASLADDLTRLGHLRTLEASHGAIARGLLLVLASGAALFLAHTGAFVHSGLFWLKMSLVALLVANGAQIRRAGARAAREDDEPSWHALRLAACGSLALWLLTTLAGAALPNLG
jgi:uncharacterized membrane protein